VRVAVIGYGAIVEGTGESTGRFAVSESGELESPAPRAAADVGGDARQAIPSAKLERQLDYIAGAGFHTPIIEDLVTGRIDPEKTAKSVVLTFDGGLDVHYRLVYPLLRKFGLHASFFIPVDRIDKPGGLARGELDMMVKWGMGIGVLAAPAEQLLKLSSSQLHDELVHPRRRLEEAISRPITTIVVPGRKLETTGLVAAVAEAGYHGLLSTDLGNHYQKGERDLLIVARFMARRTTTPDEWKSIVRLSSLGPAKLAFFVRPLR
jgi:hypothetical protein